MPAINTHHASRTANAHDVSTNNGALPDPSATGRAQPITMRPRTPAFSSRTCKSAGRKVASRPMTMRDIAFAVMDISRAYVNTPSKNGNTDTFLNDEAESTSDSATNEHQNAGVNRPRMTARSASVCRFSSVMPAFYHGQIAKAPPTRRCTALHRLARSERSRPASSQDVRRPYAWPVAANMPARRPSTMVRPQARPVNRFG